MPEMQVDEVVRYIEKMKAKYNHYPEPEDIEMEYMLDADFMIPEKQVTLEVYEEAWEKMHKQ